MVNIGLACHDKHGQCQCIFPNEHICNIIIFNETCLSIDGSEGNEKGVCSDIVLHDPRFPMAGKATNKDSLTATLIGGSNAVGEALPPTSSSILIDSLGLTAGTNGTAPLGSILKGGWMIGSLDCILSIRSSPFILTKKHILKCNSGPGQLQIDLLA